MPNDPRLGTIMISDSQQGIGTAINENVAKMGALLMGSAKSATTTTPPVTPIDGDVYIVPTGATGIWVTRVGNIAHYQASKGWLYYVPAPGWVITVLDRAGQSHFYNGSAWQPPPFAQVDLNTTALLTISNGQLLSFSSTTMEGGLTFAGNVITTPVARRMELTALVSGDITSSAIDAYIDFHASINTANSDFLGRISVPAIGTKKVSILLNKKISLSAAATIGISVGTSVGISTFSLEGGMNWFQLS